MALPSLQGRALGKCPTGVPRVAEHRPAAQVKLAVTHRQRCTPLRALPELHDTAVDVVTTAAASGLIIKAASHSLIAQGLQHTVDGGNVSQLLHTMHHAIHGSHTLFQAPHMDIAAAQQSVAQLHEVVSTHIATTPLPPLDSATLNAMAAAGPVLADIGNSEHFHEAASVIANATADATYSSFSALSAWALDRLAVVQTIDPDAYANLDSSIKQLLSAASGAFDQSSHLQVGQWTNALVLGMQQLVTTLRFPGPATSSIGAMVAAQEAMQATLATSAGAVEGAVGLDGLLKITMGIIAMVVASIPRDDWNLRIPSGAAKAASKTAAAESQEVPMRYDTKSLDAYFANRPIMVLQRNAEVVTNLTRFGSAILMDYQLGQWDAKASLRAVQFMKIVEDLGPAYIKIAQQLSTRVDLVPEAYLSEFQRLQDNVKTFSTVEARAVLEEGLGQPVDAVFEWLSEEPLAAASLGQVYRGKLREELGGGEVAVKVQRPNILEQAALDIFIMRRAAILFSKLPGMSDQWASVVDDWGTRFFEEMDYKLEAQNTMTFKSQMAMLEGVRVATVYPNLTSRKVIVTEWVEGEKLNDSKAEDVKALCSTMLNCYLIQLLETGLLHADPHPGNLLRTADGKIVILDFGLMTEVKLDQRIALVEFISHLTTEDWDGVAGDLVKLGFMPEGMPPNTAQLIAPVLEAVMGQIVKGGGLKGLNIASMTGHLEGVAKDYKMCIPGYFALVLRAFCVIEGIALKTDPNYAIVKECLPYLSRRLLTDNNPRMRAALKQLLYGKGTRLDVARLTKLIGAFGSFTTSATPSATGPTFSAAATSGADVEVVKGKLLGAPSAEPVLNDATKEVLRVVFAKDGSYAQEIMVEELVTAIDAMSREALGEALRLVMSSATTVAALRSVEALGPLRSMLMPLPLPMDMLSSMEPAIALSAEDRQTLATIRTLSELVQPSLLKLPEMASTSSQAIRAAGELMPMVPELLPGMRNTLELFMKQMVRRMALRLAEDLSPHAASTAGAGSAGLKPVATA